MQRLRRQESGVWKCVRIFRSHFKVIPDEMLELVAKFFGPVYGERVAEQVQEILRDTWSQMPATGGGEPSSNPLAFWRREAEAALQEAFAAEC